MQESTFSMTTVKDVNIGRDDLPPMPPANASPDTRGSSRASIFKTGGIQDARAPCVGALRDSIDQSLPEFTLIEHCRRVQMQLYVMIRKTMFPHVSNIKSAAENTGLFSIFPNKGGVLVAFDLYGTKVSMRVSHPTYSLCSKSCVLHLTSSPAASTSSTHSWHSCPRI
jgi:hypothetical protein